MADCDDFVTVVRNKRGKRGARSKFKPTAANRLECTADTFDDSFDLNSFLKRLDCCKQEILLSDFFNKSYDQIVSCLNQMCDSAAQSAHPEEGNTAPSNSSAGKKINNCQGNLCLDVEDQRTVHILSYGIGNFVSCLIARYQLAFLLVLRDKLEERCRACEVFDPVFTTLEKSVLGACNCKISSHNEEGKRSCNALTIAFMPHCGKALYNNLLWKNAASTGSIHLFNLLLIGNSFDNMVERTPNSQLQKTANYILKLHPHRNETQLENIFVHKDIFNDLALHWFPLSRRSSIQHSLGHCEEPVYDKSDAELIRS